MKAKDELTLIYWPPSEWMSGRQQPKLYLDIPVNCERYPIIPVS